MEVNAERAHALYNGNMGNCGSAPADGEGGDAKKRSQAIDRTLEDDSRKLRKECKILLLGVLTLSQRMAAGYKHRWAIWTNRRAS